MNVRLAVPTRGTPNRATVIQLEKIESENGLAPIRWEQGHLTSADVRNRIVKWVMTETSDDLIMCDDDVVPPPDILGMAGHGLDIVTSPTPVVRAEANLPFFNVYKRAGVGYLPLENQYSVKGIVEADAVGTGCIYISRRVMHKVRPMFDFTTDEWGCMVQSEDICFSERARQAGFKIHADFDRVSEHVSSIGVLAALNKFLILSDKIMNMGEK
jgi:hypothetical protein